MLHVTINKHIQNVVKQAKNGLQYTVVIFQK